MRSTHSRRHLNTHTGSLGVVSVTRQVNMPSEMKVGDYTVYTSAQLGKGGFGTVHLAQRTKKEPRVAAKNMDIADESKRRSVYENLTNYVHLEHGNVVKIYDVLQCCKGSTIWTFMEYCLRGDLNAYFQEVSVGLEKKLALMLDMARGVEYLHINDIVHRDIKPGNVLIDGTETAKLTDFDLSKILNRERDTSAMKTAVGTQTYKAPEFFHWNEDKELRYHRSIDIYSLGLTCLAMTRGRIPLAPKLETHHSSDVDACDSIGQVIATRMEYGDEPLDVLAPSDGEDVVSQTREVIRKMTCAIPQQRPTAAEASSLLRQVQATHFQVQECTFHVCLLYFLTPCKQAPADELSQH